MILIDDENNLKTFIMRLQTPNKKKKSRGLITLLEQAQHTVFCVLF